MKKLTILTAVAHLVRASVILLAFLPSEARADIITFESQGVVNSTNNNFVGVFLIGDPFKTTWIFDSDTPDSRDTEPTFGDYFAIVRLIVTVGDPLFPYTATTAAARIRIINDATTGSSTNPLIVDGYNIQDFLPGGAIHTITGPPLAGFTPTEFALSTAGDNTQFSDDSLPLFPPAFDLTLINSGNTQLVFNSGFGLGTVGGDIISLVRITGFSTTEPGTNVVVQPTAVDPTELIIQDSPVVLIYPFCSALGDTTVTITENGPSPPTGLKLGSPAVYMEVETTATCVKPIEVCVSYKDINFAAESKLTLRHFTDPDGEGPALEEWVDITSSHDIEKDIMCGSLQSLGTIALFQPADPLELLLALVDTVIDLNARQGIINSLDSKLDAAILALTDASEANNVATLQAVEAFIDATQAQSGIQIEVSEADGLVSVAEEIIFVLNNPN